MKFFPATAAGGPDFLKAVVSPLQNAVFCPTGGLPSRRQVIGWLYQMLPVLVDPGLQQKKCSTQGILMALPITLWLAAR